MNSGAPSAVHAILQALASLELHRLAGGNLHGLASGRVTAFTRRAIGNPEFSIDDGANWTSSATTVASGAKVKVRLTSSATGGAKHSATLTIGGVSDTWDVTTASDTAPDAFSFTDQTGVQGGQTVTSDAVTVAGINAAAAISVSGDGNPEFSIDDGANWMSSATTVASGAKVKVRLTSSATGGAKHSATLTIGGVSDTWDVTTANAPAPGDVTAKGVYAGEYSGAPLYTTAADEGITWYNDSQWPWNPVVQGADSTSDGKPNTDKLVNATSGYPPYQAAVLCRNKGPD